MPPPPGAEWTRPCLVRLEHGTDVTSWRLHTRNRQPTAANVADSLVATRTLGPPFTYRTAVFVTHTAVNRRTRIAKTSRRSPTRCGAGRARAEARVLPAAHWTSYDVSSDAVCSSLRLRHAALVKVGRRGRAVPLCERYLKFKGPVERVFKLSTSGRTTR